MSNPYRGRPGYEMPAIYWDALQVVCNEPTTLRAVDVPRLLESLPPSVASRMADFKLWLLDQPLPPRTKLAVDGYTA